MPFRRFREASIVGYGFSVYFGVLLLKFPLTFFFSKFRCLKADGLSYRPWVRDIMLIGLAMACRSNFSYLVASYAFGSDIFSEDTYAIVFFALLLSMIITPLLLKAFVAYYEKQTQRYLDGPMFKMRLTEDTQVPLYLSIQSESKPIPRLNGQLKNFAADSSLAVIDQRTVYMLGGDMASVRTELYIQDMATKVKLVVDRTDSSAEISTDISDEKIVSTRREELKEGLLRLLGDDSARVKVQRWYPHEIEIVADRELNDLSGGEENRVKKTVGILLTPEPNDSNRAAELEDEDYDSKMTHLARSLLDNLDNDDFAAKKISGQRIRPRLASGNVWEERDVNERSNDPRVKARLIFQDFGIEKTTSDKLGGYIRRKGIK